MRDAGRSSRAALAAVRRRRRGRRPPRRARRGRRRRASRTPGAEAAVPGLPTRLRAHALPRRDLHLGQRRRRARHPRPLPPARGDLVSSTAEPATAAGPATPPSVHRRRAPRPGHASDEALIATTRAALDAGIAAARPGARLGDVAHAIGRVARAAGYGLMANHGGHGIGRDMHEAPHVPNEGRPGRGSAAPRAGPRARAHAHHRWHRRLRRGPRRLDPAHRRRQPGRPHRAHRRRHRARPRGPHPARENVGELRRTAPRRAEIRANVVARRRGRMVENVFVVGLDDHNAGILTGSRTQTVTASTRC